MSSSKEVLRNDAIAAARSLPDLINKLNTVDPGMAKSLTEKSLVQSKSVWGTAIAMVVSWVVTRYGIQWDDNTCALVTGVLTMAINAGLRMVTKQPIGSIMPK